MRNESNDPVSILTQALQCFIASLQNLLLLCHCLQIYTSRNYSFSSLRVFIESFSLTCCLFIRRNLKVHFLVFPSWSILQLVPKLFYFFSANHSRNWPLSITSPKEITPIMHHAALFFRDEAIGPSFPSSPGRPRENIFENVRLTPSFILGPVNELRHRKEKKGFCLGWQSAI